MISKPLFITAGLLLAVVLTAVGAQAQQSVSVNLSIKNHRFQPAQLHVPAGVPIMLRVNNLDPTPMEFESVSLRVEKVVTGNGEGVIRLRPLSPGSYNFFDDFNQQANGVLTVR
jgi:Cupredoxin-like domain